MNWALVALLALASTALPVPSPGASSAREAQPVDAGGREDGRVAFLLPEDLADAPGPEARAALELARRLRDAFAIVASSAGSFRDGEGREVSLDGFDVVWLHEGDRPGGAEAVGGPGLIEALGRFVRAGGGLFLSGRALELVHALGVEPARPRRLDGGRDAYIAGIVPVDPGHPIFEGLRFRGVWLDESVGGNPRDLGVSITDAGFPASADFFGTGGPRGGKLLARATAGAENPVVEYALGGGRIVALGWRLPHYAHGANAHRENLERLTGNILRYLGERSAWREIPARTAGDSPREPAGVPEGEWESAELAIRDLMETFPETYPQGPAHLARLGELRARHDRLLASQATAGADSRAALAEVARGLEALRSEALLENPLLSFGKLLLIERGAERLGLPANYHGNSDIPPRGYDNRIAVLSPLRPDGTLETLYRPAGGEFVGDVDLHFDGDRLLFSMPGTAGRWQVFELALDGSAPRELPLIREPDVDNYDACYLPDGRIVFCSTATFAGVPCVFGASHVTNLYLLEHDGSIRQLTVDQDHDWCPTVANDGRVLYLRWEYADLPHSNSRILFLMNPDGTQQMECYGSNSFFPNSFFFARPVPGHPTRVAGIATGHHGVARSGRLLILDPAMGRQEAGGVVQEIPGRGKPVMPVILDNLADGVWPQLLHPFPLSEKHFLVSGRLNPGASWGIYLADVFDNLVLVKETSGYALLEPVPLRATPRPPAIPDRVDRSRKDAIVALSDIYQGEGLRGIPRGSVQSLRVISYHYAYRGMGGLLGAVGMDGPWDVKRILGTVPVEADGSARFRVPANTPIAVQPLDGRGQALQLMRSWFTAMPGEVLSCVGCHEPQNTTNPNRPTMASARAPSEIEPWYGPARGFSFEREVQPVLDRHCVGCHDGAQGPDGAAPFDLRRDRRIEDWSSGIAGHVSAGFGGKFSVSYAQLHRFVRRPGIESDIRLLTPMEFHAETTELVQLLRKGHGGARLDAEDWDRIVTWIDLNAPYHGTWSEIVGEEAVRQVAERRREMSRRCAGVDIDPEAIPAIPPRPVAPVLSSLPAAAPGRASSDGGPAEISAARWPFGPEEARQRQVEASPVRDRRIELAPGISLALRLVPAGELLLGDDRGEPDERPRGRVRIRSAFWMGTHEVTNEQFALFEPSHRSRVEPMHGYQFGIHGYPVDGPRQPVVRVSWDEAMAFCEWLSRRTGLRLSLPTEAQWEWACRAGTDSPFSHGDLDADFSRFANLADATLQGLAIDTYIRVHLVPNPSPYDDWVPRDPRFDDGGLVSVAVGGYEPNPWGLHDLHGNVWEWTRSEIRPYPYREDDGRNDPAARGERVVRGGSWYDRPHRARSAYRLAYRPYQRVFNVGFRVVAEAELGEATAMDGGPSSP